RPVRVPDVRPRPAPRPRLPSLAADGGVRRPRSATGRHPRADVRAGGRPRVLPLLARLPAPAGGVDPTLRRRRRALPEPDRLPDAPGRPAVPRTPPVPVVVVRADRGRGRDALS